jgi:hypothetical protein
MTWYFNEIVRSGNSQARIKNYYPDTGLIVLYDIKGVIEAGSTIVGDESGTTTTLTNFVIAREFDLGYEPDYWDYILENGIYDDSGDFIALDAHFTGKPSQDYQTTYWIVLG